MREGIAACPATLPFGTKVMVNGKTYTCEDRMNERYRWQNFFDIWMPDIAEAKTWGRQQVDIQIIYEPK